MANSINILILAKKDDGLFKYRFTDIHIEMLKNISPTIHISQAEFAEAGQHLSGTDIIVTWS